MERQNAYWRDRAEVHNKEGIKQDKVYEKELIKLYNATMSDMRRDIDAWVGNYAMGENITYAEAQKRISKMDVEAFASTAEKYVKEKNFSDKATAELKLYNLKMRVSRAELLQNEIKLELIALANEEEAMLRERLERDYKKELERQAGILGMSKQDAEGLAKQSERIINGNYHSATFSDRIWSNQKDLQLNISRGINRSIIQGKNPKVWANDLKQYINHEMINKKENATFVANRLAITESARVQTEIAIASYEKMGFTKYVWVAEPTACKFCMPHNGEVYDIKDIGKSAPMAPLHPFCRCSMAAHIGYEEHDKDTEKQYNKKSEHLIDEALISKYSHMYKSNEKRRIFAKELLADANLDIPVSIKKISAHGNCGIDINNGTFDITSYNLNSGDSRGSAYQFKTMLHEYYHARAKGLPIDVDPSRAEDIKRLKDVILDMEETFAEVASHYLINLLGNEDGLSPSYSGKLVRNLPRLKQLDEFKDCKTLIDFGEKAITYRFGDKATIGFEGLHAEMSSVPFDLAEYARSYVSYMEENKEVLIDKLLENSPHDKPYKKNMLEDLDDGIKLIKKGSYPRDASQAYVVDTVLINAMNKEGIL